MPVSALDPSNLDWAFFGGVLALLVAAFVATHGVATTAVRHRPMWSRTRLLVGVVLALWLLVVAAAVLATGMDDMS